MADLLNELRANTEHDPSSPEGHITETEFIILGLELEHEQRKFKAEMKDKKKTNGRLSPSDLTAFEKRRESLGQRIEAFFRHQLKFMPAAVCYRSSSIPSSFPTYIHDHLSLPGPTNDDAFEEDAPADEPSNGSSTLLENAESIDLLLPSDSVSISKDFATQSLVEAEARVRAGRLETHLTEIRRLLRVKSGLNLDKRANSVGQKAGTRSNSVLNDYAKKIIRYTAYYNEERTSLLRLDSTGVWQHRLRHLEAADVRAINANADEEHQNRGEADSRVWREGRRTISWIWKVPRSETGAASDHDLLSAEEDRLMEGTFLDPVFAFCTNFKLVAIQVEWAKAHVRVCRFEEEQELVLEEMIRVQRYFGWKVLWWQERELIGSDNVVEKIRAGCVAYAKKQAQILVCLNEKFMRMWKSLLPTLDLPLSSIDI